MSYFSVNVERRRVRMSQQRKVLIGGVFLIIACLFFATPAFAVTGEGVFTKAAENILCNVLHEEFGAMLTAIAGILAIVAAAAGSFKGAWALLFVSVGSFVADALVGLLFSNISC